MTRAVFVLNGARTAFMRAGTDFLTVSAADLGRAASVEAMARSGVEPGAIDQAIFGNIATPVDAANIARVIAMKAGVPKEKPAHSVSRNCASGIEAVVQAARLIQTGEAEVVLAGGVENMTQIPFLYRDSVKAVFAKAGMAKSAGDRVGALAKMPWGELFNPVIGLKEGLNDPVTGRMITNVTMIASDTNLVKEITFNPTNSEVNVLAVGGQDGSTNRSTITVKVKFSDGTEQDVIIPVIIYQPLLAATTNEGAYNATFGVPLFNPQTSLYEQKVSVVNNTPFDFTALRITATNLPSGVTLRNASITNGGLFYIEYNLAVRSGSNVTLTLEYYNANRAGTFIPGLKLELLNSSRVIPPPTNPVMTAVTARRGYAPDGRVRLYIEFPTEAGLTYYVQYQDIVGPVWKTSPVIIPGTGNRLNWLDEGAPNTDSPPTAARFYRIVTGN